jgi:hypothetical protein
MASEYNLEAKKGTECSLCKEESAEYISGWRDYDRFTLCVNCTDIIREIVYTLDGIIICDSCKNPVIEEEYLIKCRCYLEDWRAHEPKGPKHG